MKQWFERVFQWMLFIPLLIFTVWFMRLQYPRKLVMRSPDSGREAARIVERLKGNTTYKGRL